MKKNGFCNSDCEAMYKMGIPLEKEEWLGLGYLMRTISTNSVLNDQVKKEIQSRLIKAFRKNKYQPEHYESVITEIENVRHVECQEKMDGLEEIIDSMSNIITGISKDVSALATKQAVDISEMDTTAGRILQNIKSNRPPSETLSLVNQLKGNCKDVLKNVDKMQSVLKEQATFDALTKLYNRRSFDTHIKKAVELFQKDKSLFSLIMIDIDRFKKFNDTYGHIVGDQVLGAVSGEIRRNIGNNDFAARYGGEEMVVIFDGLNLAQARDKANSIRGSIQSHDFLIRDQKEITQITASIGVSECRSEWRNMPTNDIIAKLVEEADAALYRAKENGRNRVCVAE